MDINVPTEIVEAYVFANTPAYLYRKLVASTHVSALNKLSKDNLSELVLRSTGGSVESVSLAYAALLSLLRTNEVGFVKELISKTKLDWANEIITLYQQKNTSVNNAHYTQPISHFIQPATTPPTATPQKNVATNPRSNPPSSNFVSYSLSHS